jgi:anti-anti-sigma factor
MQRPGLWHNAAPMGPLTVTVKTLNGKHAELSASGEIDASTQELLRSQLLDVLDRGANDVVLDLAEVSFLDSSGLRGLVEALQRGASLRLRNLQPAVKLVFDIVEVPGLIIEA